VHESSKLVKQDELLNLVLLHLPLKACALKMHLSYNTVRKYASEHEFLIRLKELSASLYEEIIQEIKTDKMSMADKMLEASDMALDKLKELLESKQEKIVLEAANSLLDRTVETARNRKIEGNTHGHLTIDPMTLIHAAATSMELDAAREGRVPLRNPALPAPPQDASDAIQP